mmetsp:Transcript_5495/g.16194  ORF Transcript_5495/g.16194 Transcript_5495/m.16194 type:complete len:286 (-) Transcript_5495:156-1013(-)
METVQFVDDELVKAREMDRTHWYATAKHVHDLHWQIQSRCRCVQAHAKVCTCQHSRVVLGLQPDTHNRDIFQLKLCNLLQVKVPHGTFTGDNDQRRGAFAADSGEGRQQHAKVLILCPTRGGNYETRPVTSEPWAAGTSFGHECLVLATGHSQSSGSLMEFRSKSLEEAVALVDGQPRAEVVWWTVVKSGSLDSEFTAQKVFHGVSHTKMRRCLLGCPDLHCAERRDHGMRLARVQSKGKPDHGVAQVVPVHDHMAAKEQARKPDNRERWKRGWILDENHLRPVD